MQADREVRSFQLTAGHAALDLVNTLDWRFRAGTPDELLGSYGDLIAFAAQLNLLTAVQARRILKSTSEKACMSVLGAAREFREGLAEILYARLEERKPTVGAVKTVERYFNMARSHQELCWQDGRLVWEWADAEDAAGLPLWMLVLSAERLMTSDELELLRACGDLECRWLFLDTSKNHTRRWCNMKVCGNRMKARRFKALRRTEA